MVKNLPAIARDPGLMLGSERYPGGGHGNPLQYSCLENPKGERSLTGYSPWGHRVRYDLATTIFIYLELWETRVIQTMPCVKVIEEK